MSAEPAETLFCAVCGGSINTAAWAVGEPDSLRVHHDDAGAHNVHNAYAVDHVLRLRLDYGLGSGLIADTPTRWIEGGDLAVLRQRNA